jgi:hypothetical protein
MRDRGGGVGARTKKGQALMNEVIFAVLGVRPWLLDVLDGKGDVWGYRSWEGCRVEIRTDEFVGTGRERR